MRHVRSIICVLCAFAASSCGSKYVCDTPRVPYDWQSGSVLANGITLHYYRTGNGSLPPMVLLHGFTDNGLCWTDLAHAFEKDYDVIMCDLRGHGFSDAPLTGYMMDDYVADTVGLIGALKLNHPVIMGHSLGGSIAAALAAGHPDIPKQIVLIDPPGLTKPMFENADQKKAALLGVQKDMNYLQNASLQTLLKEAARRHPAISESCRQRWADAKAQMKPQIAETIINIPCLKEQLPKITTPTLILKADADEKTKTMESDVVKNLPNITLVHIQGATHLVHLDRPEATMAELRKFLKEPVH